MKIKNHLIIHMKFFLINKLFLLRKEVYYIKWSINYIKSLDIQLNNSYNKKDKSQFIKDCELILDYIKIIDEKIKNILKYLSNNKQLSDKSIIKLIVLFDCINERINNSILKKFDYVYKAYENLILSYNHLYIPTTSVSKLAKTPNLMLFFNKTLNFISKKLSNLIKNTQINSKKIFSTWNFIDTDHLADSYDEDKVYLELSFWLYEMPIFHCIAIHEIYHKYYFDENNKIKFNEKEDLSFFKENIPNIIQKDIKLLLHDFSENFIMSLYQEILADLHTYMITKESYIYTLFINGFLSEFNHSFLKNNSSNKNPSNEEECCFEKIKNISIYNFDFKKKQISYFVRLFFLLKYIKKYDYKTYKESEIIQFIENILLTVFPDENSNNKLYENLDNFLKDFSVHKMYKKNKYIIQILVEIYYQFFIHKGVFELINKREKQIKKFNSSNNEKHCNNYKKRFNKYLEKIKEIEKNMEKNNKININTFIQINHFIQEEFRKDNINILLKRNIMTTNNIYFLTNIKISREKDKKDAFLIFKDSIKIKNLLQKLSSEDKETIKNLLQKLFPEDKETIKSFIIKIIELKKENSFDVKSFFEDLLQNKYFYSFGPFDFLQLIPKKENFIEFLENHLNILLDSKSFLIDNHSLFHIKTYNHNYNEKNFFNLLLSIDINNAFSNEKNEKKIIEEIDRKFTKELLKKYKAELFLSMGNENLILLIYNIKKDELEKIIDEFHECELISHISSTILLNENFFEEKNSSLLLEDLILLVKLQPPNIKKQYQQLSNLINFINSKKNYSKPIRIFKKLGVYDAKIIISEIQIYDLIELIKEISKVSIDIQIEKEIKI